MTQLWLIAAFVAVAMPVTAQDTGLSLSFPMSCTPGTDCFFQQLADMDPGAAAVDPFCRPNTNDGHNGTDIRVAQVADLGARSDVLAAASGTVTAVRDGVPDRLSRTAEELEAVANRGCGNGVVIDHGGGWTTQYCHLARGSIRVARDDEVAVGARLGEVGLSGRTQFPHLEFILRREGEAIDPFTGLALRAGCRSDPSEHAPLWADASVSEAAATLTRLIDAGFAGGPVEHADLTVQDPLPLGPRSGAIVVWGHAINLLPGDRIEIALEGDGDIAVRQVSETTTRPRASFSFFAGVNRPPTVPGRYAAAVRLLRGDAVLEERALTISF